MKAHPFAILLLLAGSATGWGAQSKEALENARGEYRQTVSRYGTGSPEARAARERLRAKRRAFHAAQKHHTAERRGTHRDR